MAVTGEDGQIVAVFGFLDKVPVNRLRRALDRLRRALDRLRRALDLLPGTRTEKLGDYCCPGIVPVAVIAHKAGGSGPPGNATG